MAQESNEEDQAYIPTSKRKLLEVTELVAALKNTEKNSDFSSPLSVSERFSLSIQSKVLRHLNFDHLYIPDYQSDPIDTGHRVILEYLYQKGHVKTPSLHFIPNYNDVPKLYSATLTGTPTTQLSDGNNPTDTSAHGWSDDDYTAASKTIGEFLERRTLLLYKNKELKRASVAELRKKGIHFADPFLLAGFSEKQKEIESAKYFDSNSIFQWVEGISLTRQQPALIPAQCIYWNYKNLEKEPLLRQPITNGGAGHFSRDQATLRGLYELIERDSFFMFWLNTLTPPRIDPDALQTEKNRSLLRKLDRYRFKIDILDITSDLSVPTFVAVIQDPTGKGPALSIGASAHHEPETAIHAAITESLSLYCWLRRLSSKESFKLPTPYEPFSMNINRKERLLLWSNEIMKKHFNFFLAGEIRPLNYTSSEENRDTSQILEQLVQQLRVKGDAYEVFAFYPNQEILTTVGYHVAKIVVPALIPLYLRESCAPLGAKRLSTVLSQLSTSQSISLNPFPHPFP